MVVADRGNAAGSSPASGGVAVASAHDLTDHRDHAGPELAVHSQGVRIGSTIHVSGMTGLDPATGVMAGPTIQAQTRQALRNCEAVLRAGGASLADVAQVTVLLANAQDFGGMNDAYASVWTAAPPTRAVTTLGVDLPGVPVSIMMTAHCDV